MLQFSSVALLMIQFFSGRLAQPNKSVFHRPDCQNRSERIMKMTDMFLHFTLILASLVAGNGFASGLSNQRALKSLGHQDLNLVDANFDWLQSPTIRLVQLTEF